MNYEGLKEILDLVEQFEKETSLKDWNKEVFVSWLFQRKSPNGSPHSSYSDGLIAMHIGYLSNYAKFYAKKVFKDSNLYSLDDFSLLAALFPDKKMKQTVLLTIAAMDKPLGIEVIKRLKTQKILKLEAHPEDKRAKLLSLTDFGKTEYLVINKRLYGLSKQVSAPLDSEEKELFLGILSKLKLYHQPFFERNNEEELKEILLSQV